MVKFQGCIEDSYIYCTVSVRGHTEVILGGSIVVSQCFINLSGNAIFANNTAGLPMFKYISTI